MNTKSAMMIGILIILVGTSLNQLATAQNNGKMPVEDFVRENKYPLFALHQPMDENTKYPFIVDRRVLYGNSIGDILRIAGLVVVIFFYFKEENRRVFQNERSN